jgi:hypothetical protein
LTERSVIVTQTEDETTNGVKEVRRIESEPTVDHVHEEIAGRPKGGNALLENSIVVAVNRYLTQQNDSKVMKVVEGVPSVKSLARGLAVEIGRHPNHEGKIEGKIGVFRVVDHPKVRERVHHPFVHCRGEIKRHWQGSMRKKVLLSLQERIVATTKNGIRSFLDCGCPRRRRSMK